MKRRYVVGNLVACAIVATTMALGCGGAQEEPLYVHDEPAPPIMTEPGPSIGMFCGHADQNHFRAVKARTLHAQKSESFKRLRRRLHWRRLSFLLWA